MSEIWRGIVRGFDAGDYTATVQLIGSRSSYLAGLPVSRAIPVGELGEGRDCVVVLFDPTVPADAMLVAVR